jgi:uncharacterized protein (DUF1330 family)
MSAYLVVHLEVTNWDGFRAYQQGIRSTIKPFGGWVLAASPATMLEGDAFPNQNVIIRFPTQAHVQRWWDSQAYKEIIPLRLENSAGPAQACLLPGLDGDVEIPALERYQKKFASVLGKRMAYVEQGEGDPIVFLHGNPTWSYLWRNVMPHLEGQGRLIAPDLIGMGDSEKLKDSGPDSYRFVEHRCYLDALLEQFGVEQNAFIEMILPGSILRRLGDSEKNAYGRPYLEPGEARRPTLSWPRELPIGGEPEDVVQISRPTPTGSPAPSYPSSLSMPSRVPCGGKSGASSAAAGRIRWR